MPDAGGQPTVEMLEVFTFTGDLVAGEITIRNLAGLTS